MLCRRHQHKADAVALVLFQVIALAQDTVCRGQQVFPAVFPVPSALEGHVECSFKAFPGAGEGDIRRSEDLFEYVGLCPFVYSSDEAFQCLDFLGVQSFLVFGVDLPYVSQDIQRRALLVLYHNMQVSSQVMDGPCQRRNREERFLMVKLKNCERDPVFSLSFELASVIGYGLVEFLAVVFHSVHVFQLFGNCS